MKRLGMSHGKRLLYINDWEKVEEIFMAGKPERVLCERRRVLHLSSPARFLRWLPRGECEYNSTCTDPSFMAVGLMYRP